MTNFKQLANLAEIRQLAGGSTQKMAKYSIAKREFEQIKSQHFDEEFPFVNAFQESYLTELKEYASEHPEDESAQVRYQLQSERYAVQEARKTAHIDIRLTKSDLMQKVQEGNVTQTDVKVAWELAKKNSSDDNRVLYARIKRMAEAAEQTPEAE